jgi:methylenetetrahydrofolate dehydrogenase (NADP+)/methenyltetrahydrofolate cyclohydrolase
LLVGDDAPSANYVSMKHRDSEALGIASFDVRLGASATEDEVIAVVEQFNADPAVDAYLMQYPFPKGLDYEALLLRMDPAKDVDGLHPVSLGKLVMGTDGPLPCTPHGIVELLHAYGVELAGAHVVIIGRGLTIGRPLANLLSLKRPGLNAAVTVVHTGVARELMAALARQADVLVAAAGSPGLVTRRHGEARRRCDRGRRHLRRQAGHLRCRRRRRRRRRLAVAPDRRGRSDDPGHAAEQLRRRRRTPRQRGWGMT